MVAYWPNRAIGKRTKEGKAQEGCYPESNTSMPAVDIVSRDWINEFAMWSC